MALTTDQPCGYRSADSRLVFLHMPKQLICAFIVQSHGIMQGCLDETNLMT